MIRRLLFLVALATSPVAAVPLSPIHPHPRLIATSEAMETVGRLRGNNAEMEREIATVERRGQDYLAEPFPSHTIQGGRMLNESRRALAHLTTFAFLYRLDHNPQWRQRAIEEMQAISAFPDWHPQHFLDTAEMTAAMAFGYDWLYPELSEGQRRTFRQAIVNLGLRPGLDEKNRWWAKANHNWNQVCNGGLTLGALAVAEDEPEMAQRVVDSALESVRKPMSQYAPDGGWAEGPGYWNYGTSYNVFLIPSNRWAPLWKWARASSPRTCTSTPSFPA